MHSKDERVAIQAIRMALEHTSKQRESIQKQAAGRLLITDSLIKEPHYGKPEYEADLRELSG